MVSTDVPDCNASAIASAPSEEEVQLGQDHLARLECLGDGLGSLARAKCSSGGEGACTIRARPYAASLLGWSVKEPCALEALAAAGGGSEWHMRGVRARRLTSRIDTSSADTTTLAAGAGGLAAGTGAGVSRCERDEAGGPDCTVQQRQLERQADGHHPTLIRPSALRLVLVDEL